MRCGAVRCAASRAASPAGTAAEGLVDAAHHDGRLDNGVEPVPANDVPTGALEAHLPALLSDQIVTARILRLTIGLPDDLGVCPEKIRSVGLAVITSHWHSTAWREYVTPVHLPSREGFEVRFGRRLSKREES